MNLIEFIKSYLCIPNIAKIIEARTTTTNLIFDRVFVHRETRALSQINLAEITRKIKSMPVISRGGKAIPIDSKNLANTWIEPLSIRLSDMISGATLNNLRALYGSGDENGQALVKTEIDKIIRDLMDTTVNTRNALCAQALSGKIDYQMESSDGQARYQIDFGSTNTVTLATKLDEAGVTLVTLMNLLKDMKRKIAEAGYSGVVEVQAGSNAFSTIANLIMNTRETGRMGASIDNDVIKFLGYTIYLNSDTYTDKVSGKEQVQDAVSTNKLVMYIPAFAELDYCAIDDVSGQLQATPFYAKTITVEDPSGYQVISESKPMPLIAGRSICWAEVTSSDGSGIPALKTASMTEDQASQADTGEQA